MSTNEKVKDAGVLAGGCFALMAIMAFSALFVGSIVYLVVVVLFGANLSFWACVGIGLILGFVFGGVRR